jgi:hypothetical protein
MLEEEVIDQISHLVQQHGLDEAAVSSLRGKWPNIHFTYCSDDDVSGPKPIREFDTFNVYLVDGREHCLKFTANPEVATGLVLAEVEPE